MLNFAVGPVQAPDVVRKIGGDDVPYFRTPEFSDIMLENENLIKEFAEADESARAVFITASGTAAMEAAVMNVFSTDDKVLVVNGGSFGERFSRICEIHGISYTEIKLKTGQALTAEALKPFDNQGYTGFLVNIHETSTGVYYDPIIISKFCERNNLFLVVDAISSFLADDFKMAEWGVDVMITSSQKALACPPGVSIIVLSERALERVKSAKIDSLYFNLEDALKDGERGQTPFTPAVSILLQINARLKAIDENGGPQQERNRVAMLAEDFRNGIRKLPLDICSESLSNALTPLATRNCSANDIFCVLKDEYGIWICPNGGELKHKIFRVGHLGNLTKEDNHQLLNALEDLVKRGILI